MKVVIVDDEAAIREGLIQLLSSFCPDITSIREASGVNDALILIEDETPDILFSDVEMGDGTGFDLAKSIGTVDFPIIFITAHNKYALEAFKFCAIDFIVKPIDPEDLIEAVRRAKELIKSKDISKQFAMLREYMDNSQLSDKKIVLRDSKALYFVKILDILRCEASGSYTDFYLLDKSKITVSKPLKEYEQMLEPYQFVRTHHSHLVNINRIKRLDKTDGGSIVLENDFHVPISQRKWEHVLKLIDA